VRPYLKTKQKTPKGWGHSSSGRVLKGLGQSPLSQTDTKKVQIIIQKLPKSKSSNQDSANNNEINAIRTHNRGQPSLSPACAPGNWEQASHTGKQFTEMSQKICKIHAS
jgi:hypothetical protein